MQCACPKSSIRDSIKTSHFRALKRSLWFCCETLARTSSTSRNLAQDSRRVFARSLASSSSLHTSASYGQAVNSDVGVNRLSRFSRPLKKPDIPSASSTATTPPISSQSSSSINNPPKKSRVNGTNSSASKISKNSKDNTKPARVTSNEDGAIKNPQPIDSKTSAGKREEIQWPSRSNQHLPKTHHKNKKLAAFENKAKSPVKLNVHKTPKPINAVQKPRIVVPKFVSLSNFANLLNVEFKLLSKKMIDQGFDQVSYDHIIDSETAGLIADELGYEVIVDMDRTDAQMLDIFPQPIPEDTSAWPLRPPIVTIMGHVDHGKTTILDYLRKSSVAAGEHGGITQHIGAFSVNLSNNKQICFLDTPGHAAFLKMRQRGANVTDIVVLVVAADDSVMPQTKEAIKHAKEAGVHMIVAINKIDRPDANLERVIGDLASNEVDVENFGGDTQVIPVSGKTGEGIDKLEEAIVTLSEILDIKATPDGKVEGWVIESEVKKGLGAVATVLVRRGTLKVGSCLVTQNSWCKVKRLLDHGGKVVKSALPGTPVEVIGWKELPGAGDEVLEADSENTAKKVVQNRLDRKSTSQEALDIDAINEKRRLLHRKQQKDQERVERIRLGLPVDNIEDTQKAVEEGESGQKVVPFIIKADVSGSAEAVANSIQDLGNEEIKSTVLYKAVGQITETDLSRAESANASILTFNIPANRDILNKAAKLNVKIIQHSIIYRLIEEVTALLSQQIKPDIKQKILGEARVREIFNISTKKVAKSISIAGCRVVNGVISRKALVKVIRDKEQVFNGSFSSLKHFRDEVDSAKKDTDCGITFEEWDGFEVGDVIQTYEEIVTPRYI